MFSCLPRGHRGFCSLKRGVEMLDDETLKRLLKSLAHCHYLSSVSIALYIEGLLSQDRMKRVAKHLEKCKVCNKEVERIKKSSHTL